MSAGEYIAGAAILLCEFALVGAGSWHLIRRRLAYLRGVDRALAVAVVFTVGVIASHVIPLSLAILSRPAVLVTAALLAVGAFAAGRRAGPPPDEADPAPYPEPAAPEGRALRVVATVVPLYAGVLAFAYLTTVATAAVTHVDFMEFHGPMVAHWIQESSLWEILSLYPTHHTGYDPHNGEVLQLAVVLPWRSDFAVRFVNVPYLVVTAMALTSMARHLGAGVSTAVLYAAVVVFLPVVLLLGLLTGKPDPILMAAFATGALFLLRHSRSGRGGDLVVAGLALGLAFGTKWNGVVWVILLLAVWSAGRLALGCGGLGRVTRDLTRVGLVTVAVGGIWFVRNAVATGNPFFPVKAEIAGVTVLDAPEDLQLKRFGASLSDYLTDFDSMREHILPPIYHNMLGPAGVFMAVVLLVSAAVASRTLVAMREDRTTRQVAVIAAVALVIGVAYVFTPFTAQTFNGVPARAWVTVRYGAGALLLAAPLAAWLSTRSGRLRPVLLVAAVAALLEAAHRSLDGNFADVSLRRALAVAAAALLLAALALGVSRLAGRLGPLARRVLATSCAFAVLAGSLGVGYATQERFHDRRYENVDPTLDWVRSNAPEGRRIGLVGEWIPVEFSPAFALYGPRLRNEVLFVGPDRDGIIDEYRSADALGRALDRERIDLVLVQDRVPDGASPNETWLREMGYVTVASSPALVLMEPPPP